MKLMNEQGIPSPREYRDKLIHDWWLEPQIHTKLERYFLLRAKPAIIFEAIENGELTVHKRNYSVVWINRPSYIRNLDNLPNATGWVLMSFRYCKYLRCGYVLIKVELGKTMDTIDILEWVEK